MMRKIVSWFFILMMLSGLVLIFSPDSIQATEGDFISSFDTSAYNSVMGVGTNGNYIWWCNDNDHEVYKYTMTGDYISSFDTAIYGSGQITGLGVDGSNIWTVDIELDKVFKYTMDGTYVSNFSIAAYGNTYSYGLGTDGTCIWTSDEDGKKVYKYTMDGTYISNFSIASMNSPAGLGTVGVSIWVVDSGAVDKVFKYTMDGTYVSNFSITTSGNAAPIGLGTDGTNIWVGDLTDFEIYKYGNLTTVGNTTINVYNETSPSTAIPDWNLRIYDDDTVIQYSKNTLDNPVTVNHTEYGTGITFFEISASGYYNRTYYADIRTGVHYLLNAFLLNTANADAHVYTCIVVDDSDLDHIIYINDAIITISRVINGSIHDVSSGFTDGSGRFYVPLIAGVTYTVNITAEGYDDLQDIYIPSSTVFEHTFRMASSSPTSTSYDDFWENISIDISMVSAGCMQDGNITITYLDSNSSTTNTEIRLFEIYGTTITLLNTWSNTSNSFFNVNGSINTTRVHYMSLHFNNTAFFTVSQPITIMILNVDSPFCDRVEPFDLDDRITDIVGPFTIGDTVIPWTTIIGTIVPIIILVSFGPFNTGLGILGCGISMAMMQGFLDMFVSGGFQWGIAGIGAFIAILGIMYIMTKGTGGDHL